MCTRYCLACVSKLDDFNKDMEEQIGQVTHIFKEGNLTVFLQDLVHHLADLYYTQGT